MQSANLPNDAPEPGARQDANLHLGTPEPAASTPETEPSTPDAPRMDPRVAAIRTAWTPPGRGYGGYEAGR